jgi:hypothetical protein
MRRVIGLALCFILGASVIAAATEIELQDRMFVPVAYINDSGKIMDKNHVLLGRIDHDGIVYDVTNRHLGFVEKDLTVKDLHFKTLVTIDAAGVMADSQGVVVGAISDAKIADAAGRAVMRYEAPGDKSAILGYFFFFSPGFSN